MQPTILIIDLQLFKGGSTTVNNSSYTPTEEERQLQALQVQFAQDLMPNALWLNDIGRNLLENSLGAVQVDFNKLNNQAQNQINAANQSNMGLGDTINASLSQAGKNNQDLINEAADLNSQTMNNNAQLANGVLPQAYLDNMTQAIQSGVQNSYGNLLNNSAANGVLNSSVTSTGLNDISKNVADTMAQNYTSNIGLLSGLNSNNAQQSLSNIGLRNDMSNAGYNQTLSGAGLLNTINNGNIGNASAGITTAAGAQEAAQQPALNVWNASLGLGGAGNSTLNALAGKGTTTTTQSTSGSGGLLGGLFGGLF